SQGENRFNSFSQSQAGSLGSTSESRFGSGSGDFGDRFSGGGGGAWADRFGAGAGGAGRFGGGGVRRREEKSVEYWVSRRRRGEGRVSGVEGNSLDPHPRHSTRDPREL